MKILLVPWTLLLLGVSLNSGHYIREAEDGNPTYTVHDDSSGITFVNPKPEKPTLREILYYHIIERPQETHEEPASTERSFTNSHGNQFLDLAQLLVSDDDKDHEDTDDGSYLQVDDEQQLGDLDAENEEEQEQITTQKPLTDQDVKEAYKSRSYLFDQMRQRYSVKRNAPDSLKRRRRQAEIESAPAAPGFASNADSKDAYIQPNTYGMNLNNGKGYVWNNLNNPPTYYELGSSSGNPDEGYGSSQSQENVPSSSETAYIPPVSEPTDSGSSEDIYVNRPIAQPEAADNPELINGNLEPINENSETINQNPGPINENSEAVNENEERMHDPESSESGANYPVEPIIGDDSNDESEGFSNPIGPEVYENSEPNAPQETETPIEGPQVNEGPVESNENPGYGQQPEQSESEEPESSEEEKIKEMPEAPTLPPLNYDNLPDYIRDAISSTEKPTSYEQTDNPYTNPNTDPEDKQVLEDKMEDIFATVQPVEDIPKTYGMNLTSDGGHVWNDMVNPPVSYDVGSSSQSEEEHKEEKPPAPVTEQPIQESENPLPEPAETEEEEPIANPEEPNQESEETKPLEPEEESEEPIANPEPPSPDNEDNKPIEQPAQTEEPETAEQPEPVEPEPEISELVPEPGNEESEQPSEEPDATTAEENQKPEIMSELLKSEQFWKWLGEWTATYMELLEKHIRKIAIQEICKREKSGEAMCPLEDDSEETGVIIKDGKIIVDGKEIDMTHTDNLEKGLKRGHQNNKDKENKNKNENKIEASTIYGNSVGNEKVTNVFIFTGDKADELIDKLKPTNDSEINFVIDERIKEAEEKNKEESAENTDLEESNTDATENGPIISEENKEEVNNEKIKESEVSKEEAVNGEISVGNTDNEEESDSAPNSEADNSEGELNKEANNAEPVKGDNDKDAIEEVNKNKSNESGPISEESKNDSEIKEESTSGDIKDSELNIDESKLKPSESESK